MKNKKPKKCCYPDCFNCPYVDCRYDRLELNDYKESNKRDYEHYEQHNGNKLKKSLDKTYRNARNTAYQRGRRKYQDRHEYNQKYYLEHAEEIKEKRKENYDTVKNTINCRKYAEKHKDKLKQYQREYYLKNREKRLQMAKENYHKKKVKGEQNLTVNEEKCRTVG